ncbi:uncharacterized protein LOC108627151 [Ceratina calcarata]|uniref:Uncharacterized protein LOC108627151 n=1 Tax=Ceratina calcarata TaxID=156304 RepID=A0AAJ7J467_9HYME|nr:uncharacterized protein LOC108627151 [Ceratina calcarata]
MFFPWEIWDNIFIHADPVTLTNLKTVCKYWNETISNVLKISTSWHKLCKSEIPEQFWTTLCETINPSKFHSNIHASNAEYWMLMYKLWMKCKNMTKCSSQVNSLELMKSHLSEHISCVTTSGNLIAVGTSEGFIHFYDMSDLSASKRYVDHVAYLKSINFFSDDKSFTCICRCINDNISVWDMKTLKKINSTRGGLICTSYNFCYTVRQSLVTIEGSVERKSHRFGYDKIVAICADNNKVIFYTESGYYVQATFDMKTNENSVSDSVSVNEETCIRTCVHPHIRIRHYYIFRPNIIVCITVDGKLGFSIQGQEWKIYNIFPILHGVPTAVLIYTNLLILGLDSGNVHIFYIKDFATIEFDKTRSKTLILESTGVVSLNIMVYTELCLIVGYHTKIYVITFI